MDRPAHDPPRAVATILVAPHELDGPEVVVEGQTYRHLFRARRLATGESVRVVDGEGRARWASVAGVERSRGILTLGADAQTNEPTLLLDLLVAAPRPERAAWLVEKATEVGVAAIRFLSTARDPREYGEATLHRLRRVARAAVEQCQRARIPEVSGGHRFSELSALAADGGPLVLLLDRDGSNSWELPVGPRAFLLVGPEGGFSAE